MQGREDIIGNGPTFSFYLTCSPNLTSLVSLGPTPTQSVFLVLYNDQQNYPDRTIGILQQLQFAFMSSGMSV